MAAVEEERFLTESEQYPAGAGAVSARFVTVASGLKVRVVEAGTCADPPVVLIAGWGASAYLYRRNLPALGAAGLHAMAVDLKGQGLSDKPSDPRAYTLEALTAHALEVLDALGLERAALVGQSLGGAVATQLYLRAPDRVSKLALIAPAGFGRLKPLSLGPLVMTRLLDPISTRALPRWLVAMVLRLASGSMTPPDPRDIDEYRAPARDPAYLRSLLALLRQIDWHQFPPETLSRLNVPLLVIFGSADRIISPREVAQLVRLTPNGRAVILPGAGHLPNEERADEVNRLLVEFLAP